MGSEEGKELSGIAKLLSGRGRETTLEKGMSAVVTGGPWVPTAMLPEGRVVVGMGLISGTTGSILCSELATTSGPEAMVPGPTVTVADEWTRGGGEETTPVDWVLIGGADGPEEDTVPTRDLV